MKLYIIAGEHSGDFIGARLINALKNQIGEQDLQIKGVGGLHMKCAGLESLFSISEINLMGFFEILPHLFRISRLINKTVEDIVLYNPDALVTIDSPGFTYRVAKKLRKQAPHIKLIHLVAPSVWAYKPARAIKYANLYDHLMALLPFEAKYFTPHRLETTCIGHPVLEQDFFFKSKALKTKLNIREDAKVIAVTPGSRTGEISRHMPVIRKVFDNLSSTANIKVIFVQPDEKNVQTILKYLDDAQFDFCFSTQRLESFAVSDCALAKSGTNTLEIAASGTPMIIGYKLNPITFFFLKLMIKVKYACLINIISNREIIPEYIQSDFNSENITNAISDLISTNTKSVVQINESYKILKQIGFKARRAPSEIAAGKIIELLK
jgi:lipid-A-disaccharide synthase